MYGRVAGVAMDTPNGRLATPVATPCCFLVRIIFYLNFQTMSRSHYMCVPPPPIFWWDSIPLLISWSRHCKNSIQ